MSGSLADGNVAGFVSRPTHDSLDSGTSSDSGRGSGIINGDQPKGDFSIDFTEFYLYPSFNLHSLSNSSILIPWC